MVGGREHDSSGHSGGIAGSKFVPARCFQEGMQPGFPDLSLNAGFFSDSVEGFLREHLSPSVRCDFFYFSMVCRSSFKINPPCPFTLKQLSLYHRGMLCLADTPHQKNGCYTYKYPRKIEYYGKTIDFWMGMTSTNQ
jgi:hypothetical protein